MLLYGNLLFKIYILKLYLKQHFVEGIKIVNAWWKLGLREWLKQVY